MVAQRKAAVASKVTGRLVWLGAAEGSAVKQGQVLAWLERDDVSVARKGARANLAGSRASLAQARSGVEQARAALAQPRAHLEEAPAGRDEAERSWRLVARGDCSEAGCADAVLAAEQAPARGHHWTVGNRERCCAAGCFESNPRLLAAKLPARSTTASTFSRCTSKPPCREFCGAVEGHCNTGSTKHRLCVT